MINQDKSATSIRSHSPKETVTNHVFHFIEPGEIRPWTEVAKAVGATQAEVTDVVAHAVHLADSAAAFFRGIFILEAGCCVRSDAVLLPWYGDYLEGSADGTALSQLPIRDEVGCIAMALASTASTHSDPRRRSKGMYVGKTQRKSDKSLMQGLAVEAMLSVDKFLVLTFEGRWMESLRCLSAAYRSIIQCSVHARQIRDRDWAKFHEESSGRDQTGSPVPIAELH